jgi:calcineurin-like phosphoesterase family protein
MSAVWFCSDLHIGHKNIAKFRLECESEEHNREIIKESWGKLVTKRDRVYVLGDSAFTEEGIDWIASLKGEKMLVRGNHDDMPTTSYLRAYKEVYGLLRYKGMWLSHAPVHSDELRGKPNLHGHCHYSNMKEPTLGGVHGFDIVPSGRDDHRYLNCCVENIRRNTGECLVELRQVRSYFETGFLQ